MRVEIVGKFFDNHSLAIVNRYLALGLLQKGISLTLSAIDKPDPENKVAINQLRQLVPLVGKDIGIPTIQIRHTYPPIWKWPVHRETKVVYIQPWEFSKVPMEWVYKFDTFADHLIVPSNWTREVYLETGINPDRITYVPNGYNPEVFNSKDREPKRKFTFTFVGCAQHRKGLDILINAFSKSFVAADLAKLVIKDSPAIYGQNNLLGEILRLQYTTQCAEVELINDNLSEIDMALLYKNTDVLVHPYRGEGFGMHVQEAMACGAFPLVTGSGPTDDFVDETCGLRINTRRKHVDLTQPSIFAVKPGDSLSNMGAHAWILEPDEADLANKMRYLYSHHDREEILKRVNTASKLHTWDQVADRYVDLLTKINQTTTKRHE